MYLVLLVSAAILVFSSHASALVSPPTPLPQTGQTSCFTSTNPPTCNDTGEDGELQAGVAVPSPRFHFGSNYILTDRLTGLIWAPDYRYYKVSWHDGLAYIQDMNRAKVGGYSDWRLPSVHELESLMYQQDMMPTLEYLYGEGLGNMYSDYYWSSTSLIGERGNEAWVADFWNGTILSLANGGGSVLPVRGPNNYSNVPAPVAAISWSGGVGVPWPAPRFAAGENGAVTDNLTGLTWGGSATIVESAGCGAGRSLNWSGALIFAKCLNDKGFLGMSDWRLPNRKEIFSLGVTGGEDNMTFLTNGGFVLPSAGNSTFWSSTTVPGVDGSAWSATFGDGGARIARTEKVALHNVLVVRGGGSGAAEPSVTPLLVPFGSIERAESSTAQEVIIRNAETAGNDLVVTAVTVEGGSSGSFGLLPGGPNTCGALPKRLSPGESCAVFVNFKPGVVGEHTTELQVEFGGAVQPVSVILSGVGEDTRLDLGADKSAYVTYSSQVALGGTVDVGAVVTVHVGGGTAPATVKNGRWTYLLKGLSFGMTPVTVVATDGTNEKSVDVEVVYQPFYITSSVQTPGTDLVGGRITPSGQSPVEYRSNVKYLIQPEFGFNIQKVVIDGTKNAGKRSSYTFKDVRKSRSIEAIFVKKNFKISLSAGKGGTVTGANGDIVFSKSFSAPYLDTPVVTVRPKDGYAIKQVLVDGVAVSVDDSPFVYSFFSVDSNHTIRATFMKVPPQ